MRWDETYNETASEEKWRVDEVCVGQCVISDGWMLWCSVKAIEGVMISR